MVSIQMLLTSKRDRELWSHMNVDVQNNNNANFFLVFHILLSVFPCVSSSVNSILKVPWYSWLPHVILSFVLNLLSLSPKPILVKKNCKRAIHRQHKIFLLLRTCNIPLICNPSEKWKTLRPV